MTRRKAPASLVLGRTPVRVVSGGVGRSPTYSENKWLARTPIPATNTAAPRTVQSCDTSRNAWTLRCCPLLAGIRLRTDAVDEGD